MAKIEVASEFIIWKGPRVVILTLLHLRKLWVLFQLIGLIDMLLCFGTVSGFNASRKIGTVG